MTIDVGWLVLGAVLAYALPWHYELFRTALGFPGRWDLGRWDYWRHSP